MRKLITIIIVLVLLGLGGYYLFARKTNSPTGETTQTLSDFAAGSTSSPRNIGVINNFFRQNEASSSTTDSSGAGSGVTLTGKFSSLTKNPVAGANILTVIKTIPATKKGEKAKTETQSTLWYLDKATGNLFQISLGESLSAPEQGSVTALSGIEEAIFGSSGDSPRVLARRQKDSTIETLLGRIVSASSSAKELESTLLESGIYSIVRSPDTLRYAYLVSGTTGSIAYLANFSSPTAKKQFFTSAFPKWQISWPSSDLILFQSAPSFTLPGSIYAYNLKTNSFTKIIGGISGLTGLSSPDGKKIVYSGSDGLVLNLRILGTDNSIPLGLSSLPEKCVWGKASRYLYCAIPNQKPGNSEPDSWYQGQTAFSDGFWRVDTATGATELLYSPSAAKQNAVDGVNLFLSPTEDRLFGINKRDGTLWALKLSDNFTNTPTPNTNSTTTKKAP